MNPLPVPNWMYPKHMLIHVRDTGAIQRTDPLPVGMYWTFVTKYKPGRGPAPGGIDELTIYDNWITANLGVVGNMVIEGVDVGDSDIIESQRWHLFKVTGGPSGQFLPIWPAELARPTIAESNVKTQSDVVQAPDPSKEGFLDLLGVTPGMQKSLGIGSDTAKMIGTGLIILVGGLAVIVIGGVVYKLVEVFSDRKTAKGT